MTTPPPTDAATLDHLTVCAADFAASLRFYDAALDPIGWSRVIELGDEEDDDAPAEAAGFGPASGRAQLWVIGGATPTGGLHLAFRAAARSQVERFHDVAVAAGGTSRTSPRRWPIYRRGEFHAVVRDPDGNLIEVVSAE